MACPCPSVFLVYTHLRQDWFDEQSWPAVAGQLEEEANQCALIISQMRKDLMFERSTREELDNQLRLSVERLDELRETVG